MVALFGILAICGTVGTAATGDAGPRKHVAPWDVDDIPPLAAEIKPKLIPDPEHVIHVRGFKAKYHDITVELKGVSRTVDGTAGLSYNVNSRSWTPEGGLYRGWDLSSHWGMRGSPNEGSGARYLAFKVTSVVAQDIFFLRVRPRQRAPWLDHAGRARYGRWC